MARVYVFLADGFEEVEGLAVVDLLRRAKIDVKAVSISDRKEVTGAHGISVIADSLYTDESFKDGELLVLPGGSQGANRLQEHEGLSKLLNSYNEQGRYIAAICAAPGVLGLKGLLKGKKATIYPGLEDRLIGAEVSDDIVVVDGNIVTSRGSVGTTIDFALKLVELLLDNAKADSLGQQIQYF